MLIKNNWGGDETSDCIIKLREETMMRTRLIGVEYGMIGLHWHLLI